MGSEIARYGRRGSEVDASCPVPEPCQVSPSPPSSSAEPHHRRVVFFIPPTGPFCREDRCQSYLHYEFIPTMRAPMEECEAAGALRAIGVHARVIDAPAARLGDEDALAQVVQAAPDLLVLIATFGSLNDDLSWAPRVRARLPGVPIGVRGTPCYVHAEEILERNPDVDFCVRGEYELAFAEIARGGYADAAGVVSRGATALRVNPAARADDLDALPWPDRDAVDASLYPVRSNGAPQATVRVQRGCPFPCSYCLVHTVSGAQARHRSAASVADEIRHLQQRGYRWFYLRADTFSLDRGWAIETSSAIAAQCPGARWVTTTRVECVDDVVVGAMARAGCYGISFGIDVASDEIGTRVDKRPDRKRADEAMRLCDRHGILSLGYFMIGFLWETHDTLAETADFARDVRPDLLTIHFAHPYPGTRYYDALQESRATVMSPRAQAEPALAPAGLSTKELQTFSRRMLLRHYSRPTVIASVTRKAWTNGLLRPDA